MRAEGNSGGGKASDDQLGYLCYDSSASATLHEFRVRLVRWTAEPDQLRRRPDPGGTWNQLRGRIEGARQPAFVGVVYQVNSANPFATRGV